MGFLARHRHCGVVEWFAYEGLEAHGFGPGSQSADHELGSVDGAVVGGLD